MGSGSDPGISETEKSSSFAVLAVGAVSCTLASLEQNLANQGKDRQLFAFAVLTKEDC